MTNSKCVVFCCIDHTHEGAPETSMQTKQEVHQVQSEACVVTVLVPPPPEVIVIADWLKSLSWLSTQLSYSPTRTRSGIKLTSCLLKLINWLIS